MMEANLSDDELKKQKKDLTGWIRGTEAKLNNPGFVSKAPANVIESTKTQLADLKSKLARVEETLSSLK